MKRLTLPDKFRREIAADTRRISGVTPALTKSFSTTPWRYLPRGKGMKGLAGGGAREKGKGVL